jgi:hypothetical protein
MTSRERFERDLRALLVREGVDPMPPDNEIEEVVAFFERHGANALPLMRMAMDDLVKGAQARGATGREATRQCPPSQYTQ